MRLAIVSAMAVALSVSVFAGSAFADVAAGEKVFRKCKSCHTANEGGKHKSGPNLFGVFGRAIGGTDFKKYKALADGEGTWDEATLDKWLANPKKFNGKRTSMSLKLKKEKDRNNVIAYLKTLK